MIEGDLESVDRGRQQRERRSDRRPPTSSDGANWEDWGGPEDWDNGDHWEDGRREEQNGKSENAEASPEEDTSGSTARVLVRKAASLGDFGELDDAHSVESKIARGRGGAELINVLGSGATESDQGPICRFEEGRLQLDTGFVMQFVTDDLAELPVYDIISVPDLPSYPLSRTALESLPRWAQEKLERQGHIKLSGNYDRRVKEFTGVRLGWDDHPQNTADALAEVLQEYGGDRLARSVYYFLYQFASEEFSDPETIAELRGIQVSSVESEIRKADEELSF